MSSADELPAAGPVRVVVDPDLAPIVPEMMDNLFGDLRSCVESLDQGQLDRCETVGHQMKGGGAAYGFDFVSELGAELERASREGDARRARLLVTRVKNLLERVEVVEGEPE